MLKLLRKTTVSALAVGLVLLGVPAAAQQAATSAAIPPPSVSKDVNLARAGVYKLDTEHSSMIFRILHQQGISFSTFRMPGLSGNLTWDPVNIEASKVEATVSMNDVLTHVPGFGGEIAYEARFFDAGKFPSAKFVSTVVKRTGPTTGTITGDLTFKGKTYPMTWNTELTGVAKNRAGMTIIGLTATGVMKRSLWGYTSEPGNADEVHFILDLEFDLPA